MALALWAMAMIIRTDLRTCFQTTDRARVHWKLEEIRYGEEDDVTLEVGNAEGYLEKENDRALGKVERGEETTEITVKIRHPEEALRRVGILTEKGEEENDE